MRLAIKTGTYGLTHVVVAVSVAYTLTGNMAAAIGIGLIEPVIQTFVYALHERLWEKRNTHALTIDGGNNHALSTT